LEPTIHMTATKAAGATVRNPVVGDIIAQLRAGVREMRCVASQRMHQGGLSAGHFHLTSMLERHGPLPMHRIAELLDVSMSAATGIIDRLEERALVTRVRPPADRRIVLVELTPLGRDRLQELEVLKEAMLEKVLGRLDDRRLDALADVLGELRGIVADLAASEPDLFAHHTSHAHGRGD
jgi:DNA-binding MarR family transcriptional regulator